MNTGKSENLFKDYLETGTSLEEEEMLRAGSVNLSKGDQLWFDYQRNRLVEVPLNLTSDIKNSLEAKFSGRKHYIRTIVSIAAGVAVITGIWFFSARENKEMLYAEKLVALTEARMLLDEQAESEPEGEVEEIIYEDDLLIIYLK